MAVSGLMPWIIRSHSGIVGSRMTIELGLFLMEPTKRFFLLS